jgi:hypothetical protein
VSAVGGALGVVAGGGGVVNGFVVVFVEVQVDFVIGPGSLH